MIFAGVAARVLAAVGGPWVKWIGLAAAVAGFGLWCYLEGAGSVTEKWEAAKIQAERDHLVAVERLAKVRERVVYQYIDRYHTVKERGRTIVKEIPKYITVESDQRCDLTCGFVRVHDAAAANLLPGAAAATDGDSAGIAPSTVAATVSDNYTDCHAVREQLIALQNWASGIKLNDRGKR